MFAVLFSVVALVSVVQGREYNCTVDASLCTGSGAQTVSVNGLTMCCPPLATLNINNNDCLCVESPSAADEHQCLKGVRQCRDANSFSTDSSGNFRCCMPGYHMSSVINTNINGQVVDLCTCSLSRDGGFVSSILGLGNGGMFMSRLPGLSSSSSASAAATMAAQGGQNAGNATAIIEDWKKMGDAWKQWGQQFGQGFRTWGRNFGRRMRNTGLDLARDLSGVLQTTLTRTTVPIQRALNDMFGNLFRSIPSF
ncbi:uncharacterized protein LOC143276970 [Babylonia areolata]|uniref:uncharacterized protein LOC143276970 n=1 Tax=Babylonia areolata TaxID=304850 RepID=UPI003FD5F4A8